MPIDKNKLIAEIAARHGVRLDPGDPAFLLVDLNLMMLEDSTDRLEKVKDSIASLPEGAEKKLGAVVGQLVQLGEQVRGNIEQHAQTAEKASAGKLERDARQLVADVVAQFGTQVAGTAGQAVRGAVAAEAERAASKVNAAADSVVRASQEFRTSMWARLGMIGFIALLSASLGTWAALAVGKNLLKGGQELTSEQIQLMKNGRALSNAWNRLDPKAKQTIEEAAAAR